MKTNLPNSSLLFFLVIFFSSIIYGQKTRKIEIYNNPFVYRGNVNNQFTTVDHKYVVGEYQVPYIFETGLNYVSQKEKWGWYAGLSFMMEQQTFSLEFYAPAEYYVYRPTRIFQYNFDSYFISYKAGVNYSLTSKIQLNLGISIYDQIAPWYNFPGHKSDLSMGYKYEPNADPGPHPPEELLIAHYNIEIHDGTPYSTYFIPELRIDYEVFKDVCLAFGVRSKFWTGKFDYRFIAKVDGYLDETNQIHQTFHESKIKSQGLYTYIGIKYDIPIERWTSK
ncbi:hypothetical protein [Brumimicrobium aurantiacum]|uniref:Uncharacterized protein n=1 Tax=Brumimicrobium aurantiacum TaxID=1737063 RepID=A0A3E1F198_9FLAO|nr:hypothetical protein [Brumimicrobium aurantiacum]RFC55586.1 hypothetical protein DXU93_01250 [Brumimicrobium aurantiacum]